MKKIILLTTILLLLIGILGYLVYRLDYLNSSKIINKNFPILHNLPKKTTKSEVTKKTIFFPYWADTSQDTDIDQYNRIVYFGVSAKEDGVDKYDNGYINLDKFISKINSGKEKYLTLKMLEAETNMAILKNQSSWEKIVQDTLDIAKNYQFDGVVLDLEISIIPVIDLSKNINEFVQYFYQKTTSQSLKLAIAIYGDNFYRRRPYDLGFLSRNTDEVMIMAYDFHKSYGEPGPNFPFADEKKYGYSFKYMVDDFARYVPQEKLTVVFGMYGYDWTVDEKRKPLKGASALSLNEIENKFIKKCEWKDCLVKRGDLSKETEVNYVVSEIADNFATMYYHVVWFEDEQSVAVKTRYLLDKGIGSIAYWAYGYF